MTSVDFHFHVPSLLRYTCLLAKKIQANGLSIGLWSDDPALLERLDADLWRFEDETFLPHTHANDPVAAYAPIHLSTDLSELVDRDVLVNLGSPLPEKWQDTMKDFKRIVEIVSTDEAMLTAARNRYKIYKAAGITLNAYDRSSS